MLTARGEPLDRILGLEMGADDYLPKPFEPRELLARIRSVLRRTQPIHINMVIAKRKTSLRGLGGRLGRASSDQSRQYGGRLIRGRNIVY